MCFCCYLQRMCVVDVDFAVIYNVFVCSNRFLLLFTILLYNDVDLCCNVQCFVRGLHTCAVIYNVYNCVSDDTCGFSCAP